MCVAHSLSLPPSLFVSLSLSVCLSVSLTPSLSHNINLSSTLSCLSLSVSLYLSRFHHVTVTQIAFRLGSPQFFLFQIGTCTGQYTIASIDLYQQRIRNSAKAAGSSVGRASELLGTKTTLKTIQLLSLYGTKESCSSIRLVFLRLYPSDSPSSVLYFCKGLKAISVSLEGPCEPGPMKPVKETPALMG